MITLTYENLKEQSTHGNTLFPLHVYTHFDKSGNYSVNSHWHQEFEIIYVEKGEFKLMLDMNSVTLKSGECLFINRGEVHSIIDASINDSIHHAIVFDLSFLKTVEYDYCQLHYIEPLLSGNIKLPLYLDPHSRHHQKIMTEIIDLIQCYHTREPGYQLSIKGSLLKILSYLASENQFIEIEEKTPTSKDYKLTLLKQVVTYIHQHYTEKIYVEKLAYEVNMNPQYFCRFFKSMTGKTLTDYINHHRIEKAVHLLSTTNQKIIDISLNVGFDNFSYFIKTFKNYKQCTPSEYRRNIKSNRD